MAMKEKRIQEIKKHIDSNEFVSLDDLCAKFEISINTLRRDINILEERGLIQKIYGGVATVSQKMTSFEVRTSKFHSEKEKISAFAASLIEPNQLVFIDAGTTTQNMVKYLPTKFKYTVMTNSLDIINGVAILDNVTLMTIGHIFKKETKAFIDNDNDNVDSLLDKYNVHKAFMASTGISIEHGLTNYDIQEYGIKKSLVQKSQQVFLLADVSKFDRVSLLTYANLDELSGVITSALPTTEYIEYFKKHNITLDVI